jgi:endonuclease/exonuclease/phosphatase family metal-dependent hydrolase
VFNANTTAGGLFNHPESKRMNQIRARQLDQLLRVAGRARDSVELILGDMNAGPGVSEENYLQILEAGWVDIHRFLNPETQEVTWDPMNPLNRKGPHRRCPPQRIDHVFARKEDIDRGVVVPTRSEIIFCDPIVRLPEGPYVPVSDHFGLRIEMDIAAVEMG